jgi:Tannase-like family of unknown function (DUF6351)
VRLRGEVSSETRQQVIELLRRMVCRPAGQLEDQIIRARLIKANGQAENQIIWRSGSTNGVNMAAMLLDLINHWLDNMAAGPSPLTMEKVVSNKPRSAADTCWDLSGNKNGAGHPVQHDLSSLQSPAATGWTGVDQISLEVHLKPINFKDYEVIFTPSEEAQLPSFFLHGVCCYSKPGVGELSI